MSPEPEVNNTPWTPEWDVKDPVLERAEKALADADKVDASDTKDSIQEKIDAAQKAKDDLVKQFNKETDSGKKAKMNTEIGKMTASIAKLEVRHDAILQKAEKVLKAAAQPGEKLAAKQADVAGDIREIDDKIAALKPGDPKLTELLEDKDKLEKKQARLAKKEERTEMIARAKEYHAKAEELHRQEEQEIETKTDAALAALDGGRPEADIKTPPAAAAPKEAQEGRESNEGLSHADQLALGMAMEMVSYPPKTPGAKIFNGFKAFVLRFWCANGSKDYLWANEMPADKRELLGKVVGLKLTPTGKTNTEKNLPSYKAEWGPADPEYLAPDRTTQEVFAKFMKVPEGSQDWIPIYDRVALLSDGKPTIEDVLKSIPDPIPADDLSKNAELKVLVLKVQEISGKDPKADFFESLSKYGFQLLGKKAPENGTPEGKENVDSDDFSKAEILSVIQERKFNSQSPSGEIAMAVLQKRVETLFTSQKIDENMAMQLLPFLPTATQKTLVDGSSLAAERKTALNEKLSGETGTLDPKEALEVFAANPNAKTLVLEAISWPKLQASTAKMPEGEIKNALSKNFSTPVASWLGGGTDDQEILAALKANDPKVEAAGPKPPEAVREKAADTKTILMALYDRDMTLEPAHMGESTETYVSEYFSRVLHAKITGAPSQEALMQMLVTLPTALQREIVSQSSALEDEKVEAMIQLDKTGTLSTEKATDLLGTFNFEMTKTQLEGIVDKIDSKKAARLLGIPESDWKKPITETTKGVVSERPLNGWGHFQDGIVMRSKDLEARKTVSPGDVIHRVQAYGVFLDDGIFQLAPLTDRADTIQAMSDFPSSEDQAKLTAQQVLLEKEQDTMIQQIQPDDLIHGLWLNNKEEGQNEADYQKLQVNLYTDGATDDYNYHYDAVSKSWIDDKGAPMVLKPGSSIVFTMPEGAKP